MNIRKTIILSDSVSPDKVVESLKLFKRLNYRLIYIYIYIYIYKKHNPYLLIIRMLF